METRRHTAGRIERPHMAPLLRSLESYHVLSTAVLLDLNQFARGGLDEGLRLHPLGAVLLPMGNEQLSQVLNLVLQILELVLHPENNFYACQVDPHIAGQVQNQAEPGNILVRIETRITACTHGRHKASTLVETECLRVYVQHLSNTTNGKSCLLVCWHTLSLELRSLSHWSVIPVWGNSRNWVRAWATY